MFKAGRPLRLPEDIPGKVDLIIGPAVAADRAGNLLGDGRGLLDLAYALLSRVGSVSKKTNMVVVIDQEQIVDEVPRQDWDVPAGLLVTAQKTITTGAALPHPAFWGALPPRLGNLPLVQAVAELEG